jgi:Domain of unknown function (DUF222)
MCSTNGETTTEVSDDVSALGTMPVERLEHEITRQAAHINAATCRWLPLVGEFDRREGWAAWDCRSCTHWLSYRCGLSPAAAREQVRVARLLEGLPELRATFARGELCYSQVRALTRVATAETEGQLIMIARHASAAQLERIVRAYRSVLGYELGRPGHELRYVRCEHDDDGSLLLRARLPAEQGALVLAALEAGRDALREGRATGPERAQGNGADAGAEDGPSLSVGSASEEVRIRLAPVGAGRSPKEQCGRTSPTARLRRPQRLMDCGVHGPPNPSDDHAVRSSGPRHDGTGFAPPMKQPIWGHARRRTRSRRGAAPGRARLGVGADALVLMAQTLSRRERPSAPRPMATRWWCTSMPTGSPATRTAPAGSRTAARCTPRPPAGSGATRAWCASSSATAGRCRSDRTRHGRRAPLQAPRRQTGADGATTPRRRTP